MAKVYIGVGHGGKDSGAIGVNNIYEKNINLGIALALRDELVRHGVSVLISRTNDEFDELSDKIKECNAYNPDLCIEVHNNAGGGDGVEVYYSRAGGTGLTLAKNIETEVKAIGQNSRGCKTKIGTDGRDYFGFIRETKAPAVLVECAFVDTKDVEIVDTPAEQKTMGIALAKGFLKTLGIAYKPIVATPPAVDYNAIIASKDKEIASLKSENNSLKIKITNAKSALQ